jgi:type VI protein secretion system component Hcp
MKYLILFILVFCSQEILAQNFFLKVTGPDVAGSSQNSYHPGEIVLESFDFSFLAGSSVGKASSGPIHLRFKQSKDATKFFKRLHTGEFFNEFVITVRNSSDFDYLTYTFQLVAVSNFSSNYAAGDETIVYDIAVKIGAFRIEYKKQAPDGGSTPTLEKFEWSFVKNTATLDV